MEKMIDGIPHLIAICDCTGVVLKTNKKWKEYSGLSEIETYTTWLGVVHPDDLANTREKWDKYISSCIPYTITHRLRCVTGEYRWHHSVATRYDSTSGLHVCTSTDVHKEVLLSQNCIEISKREEACLRMITHSSDPLVTINANDGTIISVNNAVQSHLQFSREDLVGRSITTLIDEHAALQHLGVNFTNKSNILGLQTAIGTANQIQAKCKDGSRIPITFVVDSMEKSGIKIFMAVLRPIKQDITMQNELNKSKDAFLSTMSHELRTPLFGLLGTISLLHSHSEDANIHQDIKNMEVNAMSLLSIVNNMIDYYLLNHLHIGATYVSFNVENLVTDVCQRMAAFVNEEVDFTFKVDSRVPAKVLSDPNLIEHLLINLLSNALRFTHHGTVNTKVSLLDKQTDTLSIVVKDSGIGIEPEFYPQLFQPFSQSNSSDSRQYRGVGLGLPLVKSIVNLLGGSISFKTCVGHGSEFTVIIPINRVKVPILQENSSLLNDSPIITIPTPSPPVKKRQDNNNPTDPTTHPISPLFNRTLSSSLILEQMGYNSPLSDSCISPHVSLHKTSCISPKKNEPILSPQEKRLLRSSSLSIAASIPSPFASPFSSPSASPASSPDSFCSDSTSTSTVISSPSSTPPSSTPSSTPPSISPSSTSPSSISTSISSPSPISSPSLSPSLTSPSIQTESPESCSLSSSLPSLKRSGSSLSDSLNLPHEMEASLNKRVLVVEDNQTNQLIINRMLVKLKCETILASHGNEAIEKLFDENSSNYVGYSKIDYVLMDCQMPGMDGYKVTEHIRKWEQDQLQINPGSLLHLPIFALSASTSSENEAKCLSAGMDGFIAKPVTILNLYNHISSYHYH